MITFLIIIKLISLYAKKSVCFHKGNMRAGQCHGYLKQDSMSQKFHLMPLSQEKLSLYALFPPIPV